MHTKTYTEDDILLLSDREHVRLRTSMYLGNMQPATYFLPVLQDSNIRLKAFDFIPAVYKCLGEILDNSIDELIQCQQKEKVIEITSDPILGYFTVSDNGRGVPIGIHSSGKYTPEVVFSTLRSGRNFGNNIDETTIGVNGVGCSAVAMVSSAFSVDIRRDNKRYIQKYTEGAFRRTKASIRTYKTEKTGTAISFILDEEVFADITLPDELVRNRAIEIAALNPGFTVIYNKEKFKFKNGFDDLIKKTGEKYFKFAYNGLEFFIKYMDLNSSESNQERVFSWINSSPLFDGGICNTQFLNSFVDAVLTFLAPLAKKNKAEITRADILTGLVVFGNIKLKNPQFESQSKTRLVGPSLRKEIDAMISGQWKIFSKTCKQWLDNILDMAITRHEMETNRKAVKDHKRKLNKKVPGLLDANNKNRSLCKLLITEGDSASASISDVRDPSTIATFPLVGKINNVHGCSINELLSMGKLQNLLAVIGLVPGQEPNIPKLRYGKLVIATDADSDGSDIFTLLVNMFYTFWPSLFRYSSPIVYRLVAPNVVASKGAKRIHFSSLQMFEKEKAKYKGWTIEYMKGLGSMSTVDWKMVLQNESCLVPIVDDGWMKEVLFLLFGPDANLRKEWLTRDDNVD